MLPVDMRHVLELQNLPDFHRDPFDRMLIAQAIAEDLTMLTSDQKILQYQVVTALKAA